MCAETDKQGSIIFFKFFKFFLAKDKRLKILNTCIANNLSMECDIAICKTTFDDVLRYMNVLFYLVFNIKEVRQHDRIFLAKGVG